MGRRHGGKGAGDIATMAYKEESGRLERARRPSHPLAGHGLGNVALTGLVSLNFATISNTQSAKAKVTIPLN
jgi:hypothetical protein